MSRRLPHVLAGLVLSAAALIVIPALPAAAAPAPPAAGPPLPPDVHRICAWPPKRGFSACMALAWTGAGKSLLADGEDGYGPEDLWAAYRLPSMTAGSGQTVAIVDAYDNPRAESDLAAYRSAYGLPACTTANGCFRKVHPGSSTPPVDGGWATEIALDLDMVSAICPLCHIKLVEAQAPSDPDLSAAEKMAMDDPKVHYVSNSFGEPEVFAFPDAWPFGSRNDVAVTAATGDWGYGYGASYPASDNRVIAVGGTSLLPAVNSRGWTEIAWMNGGSGCSALMAKPSWQNDGGCAYRTLADVSAVADPYTGVDVYTTQPNAWCTGWCVFGGTSAATPIIAAVYALAGHPGTAPAHSLYAHPGQLNDAQGGTNSFDGCDPDYLCNAGPGYDGPTGLGTPDGTGAFVG
jgi:hypothetical protein